MIFIYGKFLENETGNTNYLSLYVYDINDLFVVVKCSKLGSSLGLGH